ncbi:MAG: hypothetical protein BECKG1743D_GA0114223_101296, partial [Candidatus Kentron sp. G]
MLPDPTLYAPCRSQPGYRSHKAGNLPVAAQCPIFLPRCYVPHYLGRIDPIFFRWDKERYLGPIRGQF